ncbi:hypothetical protein FHX42_002868 [Saccharopolyspora lacisalsi]|uniref:Uncharacterized protein n=1 Tax=Halosaccharopolyspora lacisalsi TaxID=1000566 RepID=A0A839E192_9PSEU|nr:hypothetical protein [Halosaccharopolyspora lacisalsi]MBA8825517.1 hypothetical protein [Halosaccharopolyspora lacisalsi]
MIFYYMFIAVFGVFVVVFLSVGIFAIAQNRLQPLEKRLDRARRDLLKKETKAGASELRSGAYSKVTPEMLRDIANSEGFCFVDELERSLNFQRSVVQSGGEKSGTLQGSRNDMDRALGYKRHQEHLENTLSEAADAADLTLRRDELGALPKAEILRTAQEHGWAFRDEEITGNEWRLLFRRENPRGEVRGPVAT